MTSKGIVVFGFPCVGKTMLCKKYANCIDLESSKYKYVENDERTTEQNKGLTGRAINPNWPENYFEAIMQSIQNYDFVLVADKGIVECQKHNVPYWRVYPNISCKNEYIERMKNRGNNECFISKITQNFETYIENCKSDLNCSRLIELKQGETLESKFLELNLINNELKLIN